MKLTTSIFVLLTICSSHAFDFRCRFREVHISSGHFYSCETTVANSGSNTTLMNVFGTHLPGFSNEEVVRLAVYHQHILTRFPNNLENFFPNLKVIDFWNGTFTTISASDLIPFENLIVFAISEQLVESLDSDLFSNNLKLRRINFGFNRLQNVGTSLLDNLADLEIARFNSNPCIDFNATSPEEIQELKQLLKTECQDIEVTLPATTETTTTEEITTQPPTNPPEIITPPIATTTQPPTNPPEIITPPITTTTQPSTNPPEIITPPVATTTTTSTSSTTTPDQCPVECLEQIQWLTWEADELANQEIENAEVINELTAVIERFVML